MRWALALGLLTLLVGAAACSSRRLPAGTPPPEYEPPQVTPWPAESADAGTAAALPSAAAAPSSADAPRPAAPESELSLDAGPR